MKAIIRAKTFHYLQNGAKTSQTSLLDAVALAEDNSSIHPSIHMPPYLPNW